MHTVTWKNNGSCFPVRRWRARRTCVSPEKIWGLGSGSTSFGAGARPLWTRRTACLRVGRRDGGGVPVEAHAPLVRRAPGNRALDVRSGHPEQRELGRVAYSGLSSQGQAGHRTWLRDGLEPEATRLCPEGAAQLRPGPRSSAFPSPGTQGWTLVSRRVRDRARLCSAPTVLGLQPVNHHPRSTPSAEAL